MIMRLMKNYLLPWFLEEFDVSNNLYILQMVAGYQWEIPNVRMNICKPKSCDINEVVSAKEDNSLPTQYWVILHAFLLSVDFFLNLNLTFSKKFFSVKQFRSSSSLMFCLA